MEDLIVDSLFHTLKYIVGEDDVKLIRESNTHKYYDCIFIIKGVEFLCDIKTKVTTANYGTVLSKIQANSDSNKNLLLGAIFISESLISEFADEKINTIDVNGNCHIVTDNIHIHIEGKKNTSKCFFIHSTKSRMMREAGLKIIFLLLQDPETVKLPYRKIQELSNVSLGSITIVMNELESAGYILKTKNGKFLKRKKELLERWMIGYSDNLKPKTIVGRMKFRNSSARHNWQDIILPDGYFWGGEPAAELLDGYLVAENFVIYGKNIATLVKIGLIPDNDGDVIIYDNIFYKPDETKSIPNLLIYADLMTSGNSRNIEAAQRIYENELQYIE